MKNYYVFISKNKDFEYAMYIMVSCPLLGKLKHNNQKIEPSAIMLHSVFVEFTIDIDKKRNKICLLEYRPSTERNEPLCYLQSVRGQLKNTISQNLNIEGLKAIDEKLYKKQITEYLTLAKQML